MSNRPDAPEPDASEPDTTSDPALDSGESTDWADEGGAVPDGPATDPESAEA